ncbi:FAD-dependent oxidoreductase [Dactylosporangium sp. NPDC005555]|uniref:FAD-dependent oxidoreductase n=1 Tax=Dactylosporangium sp. NPDC005555 TaxID=3154889 RepID=UPI0033AEE8DA
MECGVFDDIHSAPPEGIYLMTADPARTTGADEISVEFDGGTPCALDGEKLAPVQRLNAVAGRHGIGRVDVIENQVVGFNAPGEYECPAGTVLRRAHQELESMVLDRDTLHFAEAHRSADPAGLLRGSYDERDDAVLSVVCNDDRAYDYFVPLPEHAATPGDDPNLPRIMRQTVRQLALLHGVQVPQPRWISVRDWTADPFGSAYHGWRPGRRPWQVAQQVRQPLAGVDLFICGAAYSGLSTWLEGALGNAERLLQTAFGLAQPGWLPPATYLGW